MSGEFTANLLERCSEEILREVVELIERLHGQGSELCGYAEVEALEQEIGAIVGRLGALLMQKKLQEAARSKELQEQEALLSSSYRGVGSARGTGR
jgi:hypothetical protein